MARVRSPEREKAEKIYLENEGNIKLIDIASQLILPEGTVRGWKNKDKWDAKLNGTFQKEPKKKTERSEKKLTGKQERKQIEKLKLDEAEQLTEKQKLFCLYYIKSFNATSAAIKAGYSKAAAHQIGYENLRKPLVVEEIKRLKGLMQQEVFVDTMDVLNRYIKIAFADMNDFVEFGCVDEPVIRYGVVVTDNQGNPITVRKNFITFKSSNQVDGGLICEIKQGKDGTSLKLEDRLKALEKLALYFDLFPDKFKRMIEEKKLALAAKKAGEGDGGEDEADDGFIEALHGKVSEVWADDED